MSKLSEKLDAGYRVPLYSQAETARIVGTSKSSLQRWAEGYNSPFSGGHTWREPLITVAAPGRGATVPFVGLAEAFVLAAFRRAGLPMQRIRPAVEALKKGMGVDHALASDRLVTDGAEILWNAREGATDERLIVVRNNQAVFNEVVRDHLKGISFANGYASSLVLPQYVGVEVTVDPHVNGGRPSLAGRGISVADITSRLAAGESPEDVAYDYYLDVQDVQALFERAA